MKKVKLSVAASVLAVSLSGCSTQQQEPLEPITQYLSFGSEQSANRTVTFKYHDLSIPQEFPNYEIKMNIERLPRVFEFDLCQEVKKSEHCKSSVYVTQRLDNLVMIKYTLHLPKRQPHKLKTIGGVDVMALGKRSIKFEQTTPWGTETHPNVSGDKAKPFAFTVLTE